MGSKDQLSDEAAFAVLVVLALALLRFVLCPLYNHVRRIWQLRAIPYGEPPHWFWGHTQKTLKRDSASERWQRWLKVDSRMVKAVFLSIPRISLCHPETACAVLQTGACKRRSALVYDVLAPWIGDVNKVLSGARHRHLLVRTLVHSDRDYMEVYDHATRVMLDRWTDGSGPGGEKTNVNITDSCRDLVMDIMLRISLSYVSDCQFKPAKDGDSFSDSLLAVYQCLEERLLSPYQRHGLMFRWSSNGRTFRRCKQHCQNVMLRIISERCASKKTTGSEKQPGIPENDFLDNLLDFRSCEDSTSFNDGEICKVLNAVLFQAHDATASVLRWSLYYLAKYPQFQERCRADVQSIAGRKKVDTICLADLDKLQYLSQFINETIRLSATVPFVALTLSERTVIDGHVLPNGTWISIPILALHQNPTVWEEPLDFNPDRFLPENVAKRHPFAFMPFLMGPCDCIGRRIAIDIVKTVLALVLLDYQLDINASRPPPRYLGSFTSKTTEDIELVACKLAQNI